MILGEHVCDLSMFGLSEKVSVMLELSLSPHIGTKSLEPGSFTILLYRD